MKMKEWSMTNIGSPSSLRSSIKSYSLLGQSSLSIRNSYNSRDLTVNELARFININHKKDYAKSKERKIWTSQVDTQLSKYLMKLPEITSGSKENKAPVTRRRRNNIFKLDQSENQIEALPLKLKKFENFPYRIKTIDVDLFKQWLKCFTQNRTQLKIEGLNLVNDLTGIILKSDAPIQLKTILKNDIFKKHKVMFVLEVFLEKSSFEISQFLKPRELVQEIRSQISKFRLVIEMCLEFSQNKTILNSFPKICSQIIEMSTSIGAHSAASSLAIIMRIFQAKYFLYDLLYTRSLEVLRHLSEEFKVISLHSLYLRIKISMIKAMIFKHFLRFEDSSNYLKKALQYSFYFPNDKHTTNALNELSLNYFNTNDPEMAQSIRRKAEEYIPVAKSQTKLMELFDMIADLDRKAKVSKNSKKYDANKIDVSIEEETNMGAELEDVLSRPLPNYRERMNSPPVLMKTHLSFSRSPIHHLAFSFRRRRHEFEHPPQELSQLLNQCSRSLNKIPSKQVKFFKGILFLLNVLEETFAAASNSI